MLIAILDDDERRRERMQRALSESGPNLSRKFFDNAPVMIEWLGSHLGEVALISLDHDLGPNWRGSGEIFDPGTGRDVADYLAQCMPSCPVIVHSSNGLCVPGMLIELESAGWTASRVIPYGDLDWVNQSWVKEVKEIIPATK